MRAHAGVGGATQLGWYGVGPCSAATIAAKPSACAESIPTMYDSIKLLHLAAAIVWMGGMTFMLFALRPAALEVLEPQVRARLMGAVWRRFFSVVLAAIAVLLLTGGHMYASAFKAAQSSAAAAGVAGSVGMPIGWSLMLGIGIVMILLFGHIYFAGFSKFKRALAAQQWPVAAQAAAQINRLVVINFVLGWLAIAAVRLVH